VVVGVVVVVVVGVVVVEDGAVVAVGGAVWQAAAMTASRASSDTRRGCLIDGWSCNGGPRQLVHAVVEHTTVQSLLLAPAVHQLNHRQSSDDHVTCSPGARLGVLGSSGRARRAAMDAAPARFRSSSDAGSDERLNVADGCRWTDVRDVVGSLEVVMSPLVKWVLIIGVVLIVVLQAVRLLAL
jgi:hypothetical protein